jgi:hypothetical protein
MDNDQSRPSFNAAGVAGVAGTAMPTPPMHQIAPEDDDEGLALVKSSPC